jgi:hypothetical protein
VYAFYISRFPATSCLLGVTGGIKESPLVLEIVGALSLAGEEVKASMEISFIESGHQDLCMLYLVDLMNKTSFQFPWPSSPHQLLQISGQPQASPMLEGG